MNGKACRKEQKWVGQNQEMKDNTADFCGHNQHHVRKAVNTFDLLSGWGAPSSLPSALRGRGSLDSPGVIISARPIGANRKQEKQLSMTAFGFVGKNTLPAARLWCHVKERFSHLCPVIPASGNLETSSVELKKQRRTNKRIQAPCNNHHHLTE